MEAKPRVFLDASVLVAAVLSQSGASRMVFELGQKGHLELILTAKIVKEARNALTKKYSKEEMLGFYKLVSSLKQAVLSDPTETEEVEFTGIIEDPKDKHVLAGAKIHNCQYLLTLDRRHFITEKTLHAGLSFSILVPGDFLREFRNSIGNNF